MNTSYKTIRKRQSHRMIRKSPQLALHKTYSNDREAYEDVPSISTHQANASYNHMSILLLVDKYLNLPEWLKFNITNPSVDKDQEQVRLLYIVDGSV